MLDESSTDVRREFNYEDIMDTMEPMEHYPIGGRENFVAGEFDMEGDEVPQYDAGDIFDTDQLDNGGFADQPSEAETKRSRLDETVEGDYDQSNRGDSDHKLTTRTQKVLDTIAMKIQENEGREITLNDLIPKSSTRKKAGQKFYALLELKKHQAIDVHQEEPYGEIRITPGPRVEELESA